MVLAGVLLWSGAAGTRAAAEPHNPVAKRIADIVDGLAERVARDGFRKTLETTTRLDWMPPETDLYVFVFETSGTLRAHPDGRMVGHDVRPTHGARGRPFIKEIIAALPDSGDTVWITYFWYDTKEKRVRPIRTYARRVGLLILACGFFADEA